MNTISVPNPSFNYGNNYNSRYVLFQSIFHELTHGRDNFTTVSNVKKVGNYTEILVVSNNPYRNVKNKNEYICYVYYDIFFRLILQ